MSSIGSIGSNSMMMQEMGSRRRPNPAEMASELFSRIDTGNQGYIEVSDLQAAFSKVDGSSDSSSTAELFSQLDSDGDGKVTKDEFSSALQSVADQLDSQFAQMRMEGGMQGMGGRPPPPPPGDDAGFTKSELESQLSELGSSGSRHASLIASTIENFDAADTDGDGKVSFKEAMAHDQSRAQTASDTSSTGSEKLMMQLMKLMHAYGPNQGKNALLSSISTSA